LQGDYVGVVDGDRLEASKVFSVRKKKKPRKDLGSKVEISGAEGFGPW
jgi:hypothetical protein